MTFTGIWHENPPHHCNDVAVSILVHDMETDRYFVVNILWQENPIKFHIEGSHKILDSWPSTWKWTHIDGDYHAT